MQKIRNEIEQYMEIVETGDGGRVATFSFPPEFSGFQGHFTGRPILPGACQLQCFLSFLERIAGKELDLKEIKLAKYLLPVLPDEKITCVISPLTENINGIFTARGSIFRGDERITEIRVYVAPRE